MSIISSPLFQIEKKRQHLATKKKLTALKKMYRNSTHELFDLNSGEFWDKNFKKIDELSNQDSMTKDRVKTICNLIITNTSTNFTVLDIGIGPGLVEEYLSKNKNVLLYGNDISKIAIKNVKRRFKGDFRHESWENMSFSKNKFDVVLLLEVLEHVPPSKTFKLLSKIYKYLKKDGFFILSIPVNEGLEYMNNNPNGHMRIYTEDLVKAELEIANSKLVFIKKFYTFEKYYALKNVLSRIFINRWKPNVVAMMFRKI